MIRRLRRRFIRITMLSVALVMALLTVIVNTAYFAFTDSGLTDMLELIYENQGSIPRPRPNDGGPGRPDQHITKETPFSTRYFVLRYTDGGELTQADLGSIAAVTKDDTGPYLEAAVSRGHGFGWLLSGYRYYVIHTGPDKNMAIFLNCYQELHSMETLALLSLLADGVCILLVYLLVVLRSRRAIDPVVRAVEQQKQFITDASHELKTPLTVINTSLKVLEMDVGPQKWIDKAKKQVEKMNLLVNSLVTLSRMDEEEPPITLSDFDVSGAVSETAEAFLESAAAAGHPLALDIAPGVEYHGDEAAVRQLVSILMDNALKYALPDSEIALSLRRERRGVVIRASNPCEPIAPDALERLFDRFYRVDEARGASAGGGFGVGLSIARSIAQAHKGSITAECPQSGLIEFTVVLRQ